MKSFLLNTDRFISTSICLVKIRKQTLSLCTSIRFNKIVPYLVTSFHPKLKLSPKREYLCDFTCHSQKLVCETPLERLYLNHAQLLLRFFALLNDLLFIWAFLIRLFMFCTDYVHNCAKYDLKYVLYRLATQYLYHF